MTRRQIPRPNVFRRPEWSLDYEKYPAAELRNFIEARIGTTLSEKERRTIGNCNRSQLAKRLHKLDLASTFPRFMELPPELRVNVYEYLLVDARGRDEDGEADSGPGRAGGVIQTAVLRTSKHIYSEAQPILYKQNKFGAKISYAREGRDLFARIGCELSIIQPGKSFPFRQLLTVYDHSLSLGMLFTDSAMGMLRSLTHLTIDLNLVTPGDAESEFYVPRARNAIACLCLSLTGASKMQELTINVDLGHPQERSKVDFARILWPLVFPRTDIAVNFEGIAEILKTSTAGWRRDPHAEASYGRHIANIRHRCNKEIAKRGSGFVDLHGLEVALASMTYFGDNFVSMDDIVNLSAAWTGMRSEADRVEAIVLKKESFM